MSNFEGRSTLYSFQSFNALSYWIILGPPIVLLTLWLGGDSRAVGIVSSIMPFLTILQIPSTRYIARLGYRRAMLTGWTSRTMIILGLVFLPFFKGIWSPERLMLVLVFFIFSWSFLRGMANASWLPWLKELIPSGQRGRYFAWENIFIQVMSLIILFLSGLILGNKPTALRFSIIYFISFASGVVSLLFLGRIPSVEISGCDESRTSIFTSLKNAVRDISYRRFLLFIFIFTLSNAGFDSFTVLFLKRETALADRMILWLGAASSASMIGSLVFAGGLIDRWGSRPIMKICLIQTIVYLTVWVLLSERALNPVILLMVFLFIFYGMVKATIWIATWRLTFISVPHTNSLMALAIFNTGMGILGGISPLVWGYLLNKIPHVWLSPFGYYFLSLILLTLAAFMALSRVREAKAEQTRDVAIALLTLPVRSIVQLIGFFPRGRRFTQDYGIQDEPPEPEADTRAQKSAE